ncbi:MAG: LPXTG cell wall anchor domain-containing protein [Eggerthella sp.]|uniref:SpaA isopeptide-forming pilin-related protein n=1 Tax=Eggerthella sp. TaxID=1929886 RepID=UPI001ED685FB|nr:SpaA isopeptide-forming pilin-related protein [Eggerthella sp.]MBS6972048.1 LPXTG cell wall anchor domain-containing protein [Eggerthella sp.]
MKGLNKIKKCWKQLILALTMIFSISTASLSQINAETVKLEKGEAIRYPSWLGNWSTNYYYINGQLSYCLNSSRNEPVNNDSAVAEIHENEALLKVLYYGFGGPGDVFRDDQVTNDTTKYLYTHIMASYAYSGDIYGGKSWEDLEAHGVGLKTRYDQIQSMPVPKTEFNLNGTRNLNLKAYYENNYQRTENIQFNSSANNTITIPLDNGIELRNITKNTVSSNSAVINGGDIFYLQAKLNVRDNYSSGKLTGSAKTRYAPLIIKSDNTSVQDIGSWSFTYDPVDLIFGIEWADVGSLELTKTNDTGELLNGSEFNLKHTTLEFEKDLVVKNGKIKADNLPVGDYILTETKVPDGHAAIQKTFKVTINKDQTTERIVVNNIRADYDLTKVQFKITASQDVYDSVSLEKLYSKGDAITVGSGKGSNEDTVRLINGNELGNGIYSCDINGKLSLSGLPMGTYNVEETACPDGFVLDKEVKTVQFAQQDFVTLEYKSSLDINNELTKTVFNKVDVAGNNVSGAYVQILNENKELIYDFITGTEPVQVDGLKDGKYYFHEDLAPEGFTLAQDVEFNVKDGKIQKIKMTDTITEVAKKDESGNLLANADMEIISTKTKQIVDKWTTGQHLLDIPEDIKVQLEKGETVSNMFVDIEDDGVVEYTIIPNKDTKDYRLIYIKDGITKYSNININGDETTHMAQNLISGQEYVLREVKAPEGYKIAEEQKFIAGKDKDVSLSMTDELILTDIQVNKVDSQTLKPILSKDFEFTLYSDKECTKVLDVVSGNTTDGTATFKDLKYGIYYIKETKAPLGYQLSTEVKEIVINDNLEGVGNVHSFKYLNTLLPVTITKTGDNQSLGLYAGLAAVSILGLGYIILKRKRKEI